MVERDGYGLRSDAGRGSFARFETFRTKPYTSRQPAFKGQLQASKTHAFEAMLAVAHLLALKHLEPNPIRAVSQPSKASYKPPKRTPSKGS